jgi:hypothetical protein
MKFLNNIGFIIGTIGGLLIVMKVAYKGEANINETFALLMCLWIYIASCVPIQNGNTNE